MKSKLLKQIIILITVSVLVSALYAEGQQENENYGGGYGRSGAQRLAYQQDENGNYPEGFVPGQGRGSGRGQGAGRGNSPGNLNGGNGQGFDGEFQDGMIDILENTEAEPLSKAEIDSLTYLREEEKLARDVYIALYEKWNLPIFNNISGSESQHMESVALLIDRYDLIDPVADDIQGVFINTELQRLYDDLVEKGSASLGDALMVGATIEDLDIYDLQRSLEKADNEDIGILFQNLMKGSRNHMRSFASFLAREGIEYEAQFISQTYLDRILSINQEVAPITSADYDM